MSTKTSVIYWHDRSHRLELHVFREMYDKKMYASIEAWGWYPPSFRVPWIWRRNPWERPL